MQSTLALCSRPRCIYIAVTTQPHHISQALHWPSLREQALHKESKGWSGETIVINNCDKSTNMAQFDLIPGLPNDLVQTHIVPKVMEPIMAVTQRLSDERAMLLVDDFRNLLRMYRYMGVSRVWRRLLCTCPHYIEFRLALWDEDEDVAYNFSGVRMLAFLDAVMRTYHEKMVIFGTTQRISIPIAWATQHAPLPKLSILELAYLRDKLVENREYWKTVDRRSNEWRRCTNYWICPLRRLLA